MRRPFALPLLLVPLVMAGCEAPVPDPEPDEPRRPALELAEVDALLESLRTAYDERDRDAVTTLFTEDGVRVSPLGGRYEGHREIRDGLSAWEDETDDGPLVATRIELERERWEAFGEVAYVAGSFRDEPDDEDLEALSGYFLGVVHRVDGTPRFSELVVVYDRDSLARARALLTAEES